MKAVHIYCKIWKNVGKYKKKKISITVSIHSFGKDSLCGIEKIYFLIPKKWIFIFIFHRTQVEPNS